MITKVFFAVRVLFWLAWQSGARRHGKAAPSWWIALDYGAFTSALREWGKVLALSNKIHQKGHLLGGW